MNEIATMAGLDLKQVYEAAGKLSSYKIVKKTKLNGELAYEKDEFYARNKKKY